MVTPSGLRDPALAPEERARVAHIEALAAQEQVAALLDLLVEPSWTVRRRVAQALGELGEAAVPGLVQILEAARDDETRIAAAVDALVASRGPVEDAVLAMTYHEDPAVVSDGAQILGRRRATAAASRLMELTRHADDNVAVAALEALGRIGGRAAVDTLIEAVQSRNFFRTFPAIDVLGRTGDPRAVAPLAALLDDSRYALEATRALGRTADMAAVGALTELLTRPSTVTVRTACIALGELSDRYEERYGRTGAVESALRRSAAPSAWRHVSRALGDASGPEREELCWVLGALGDEAAIPELAELLDAAPRVARAAAAALESIGEVATERIMDALREGSSDQRRILLPTIASRLRSIDGVVRCLDDPDADVRTAACEALVRSANPASVRPLFERLGDPDPRVVHCAVSAIQSLGSADTEKLALKAARSEDPHVRRNALSILAYFGYSSALPLFLDAIGDDDARLRDTAIQGLPFIESPQALETLLDAARHPEARARASAMRALGHCHDELRASSYLLRGLSDPDGWVRYYACQSLGRLGFEAAAEPVSRLLEDPAGQVRVAAVEALSHLSGETAREVLAEAACSEDADVRRTALLGLGIARRSESLPLLREAAKADEAATRLVALSAMVGFASADVTEALAAAALDPDESVRNAAIGFLASRAGPEATERLAALAHVEEVQEQARDALSTFSMGRIRGLLRALARADDEAAPVLTAALVRMRRPEAEEALILALRDASPAGRKAAAASIGALGKPSTLEHVHRAATEDPDPEVRRVCASVVGG